MQMRSYLLIFLLLMAFGSKLSQAMAKKLFSCEATLTYLHELPPTPALEAEIAGLENESLTLKGENLDVIRRDEQPTTSESVVARVDRAVIHRHGFLHRTVVAFVLVDWPGETEPRLLVQEFYTDEPKGEVFVIGGHVQSASSYKDSIYRELLEELGFPLDTRLTGKLSQIAEDGDFALSTNDGNNQERVSVFIYRASEQERLLMVQNAMALEAQREKLGPGAFLAWLAVQQKDSAGQSTGLGEVQSFHFVKFSDVERALERSDLRLENGLIVHAEMALHLREPRIAEALAKARR